MILVLDFVIGFAYGFCFLASVSLLLSCLFASPFSRVRFSGFSSSSETGVAGNPLYEEKFRGSSNPLFMEGGHEPYERL
jgi:hypothetical protein